MPHGERGDSAPAIASAILGYMDEHPTAQDTPEGILQWWLLPRGVQCHIETVQRALAQLVVDRRVVAVRASDQRVHYRLNVLRD